MNCRFCNEKIVFVSPSSPARRWMGSKKTVLAIHARDVTADDVVLRSVISLATGKRARRELEKRLHNFEFVRGKKSIKDEALSVSSSTAASFSDNSGSNRTSTAVIAIMEDGETAKNRWE